MKLRTTSVGHCLICKEPIHWDDNYGESKCRHCLAVFEFEEGVQLVIDDEMREAIKNFLLQRKAKNHAQKNLNLMKTEAITEAYGPIFSDEIARDLWVNLHKTINDPSAYEPINEDERKLYDALTKRLARAATIAEEVVSKTNSIRGESSYGGAFYYGEDLLKIAHKIPCGTTIQEFDRARTFAFFNPIRRTIHLFGLSAGSCDLGANHDDSTYPAATCNLRLYLGEITQEQLNAIGTD